jgi:hypothetical protein
MIRTRIFFARDVTVRLELLGGFFFILGNLFGDALAPVGLLLKTGPVAVARLFRGGVLIAGISERPRL